MDELKCPYCKDGKNDSRELVSSSYGGRIENYKCVVCGNNYHAHFSLHGCVFHKGLYDND